MQITLGNALVAVSIILTGIIGMWKAMTWLEKRFEWVDEMYYFWCKENGRRVPESLAKKFVKPNGNEPQTQPDKEGR